MALSMLFCQGKTVGPTSAKNYGKLKQTKNSVKEDGRNRMNTHKKFILKTSRTDNRDANIQLE